MHKITEIPAPQPYFSRIRSTEIVQKGTLIRLLRPAFGPHKFPPACALCSLISFFQHLFVFFRSAYRNLPPRGYRLQPHSSFSIINLES